MKYQSTCKRIKEFDYDHEVVIKKLSTSKEALESHKKRLQEIFKNDKPEDIEKKVMNIIIRENVFNALMEFILTHYEYQLDQNELKEHAEIFRKNLPQDTSDKVINEIAEKSILRQIIFDDMAKAWDIRVSDVQVKESLDNYYRMTNESIRQYLEDEKLFNQFRDAILNEKIINEILKRFKHSLDIQKPESIKN